MSHVRDRYDQEVERLTQRPQDIEFAWYMSPGWSVLHSPLFDPLGRDRKELRCGCITEIASRHKDGETEEITQLVRDNINLPGRVSDIQVCDLPTFAKIQRATDQLLGREPPPLLEE